MAFHPRLGSSISVFRRMETDMKRKPSAIFNPSIKVNARVSKTPFVHHATRTGPTFSCIYTGNGQTALVALFSDPELFTTERAVPVRIHSSCANSDILGSFDCDCRSQLLRSIDILRKRNGLLIHIFQEGRGAGIFAKYLGMHTMQSKGLSTYDAYRDLAFKTDGRTYPIAVSILHDFGITNISLLSNNPKKLVALRKAGFIAAPESMVGEITPQNFGYLFSKFSEGQHSIGTLFPKDETYYFCKTPAPGGPFERTWIIDGDDTLWEDNLFYTKLINKFIDYCLSHSLNVSRGEIRRLIDQAEEQTIESHGLGPIGFRYSLEKVYEQLKEKADIPRPSTFFDSVVPVLTKQPEVLIADATHVLIELAQRGDGIVLFTQGPSDIQFEKIARSGLAEYFHAICVVSRKDLSTLRRLQADFRQDFDPGRFISVGNSLRSDVEPAVANGIQAVHFNNPNSWHVQNQSTVSPNDYISINNFSELLGLSV